MNIRTVCRMCKTEGVRLHCITNTHLQELYEHDTGTSVITEDRKPLLACITCCDRLQHCYQERNNCEQRENVLTMMVGDDQQYSNKNMAASPVEQNNTCVVQNDVLKYIKMEPAQLSEVQVKEELTKTAYDTFQENHENFEEDNDSAEFILPRIVSVKSEKNLMDEMGSYTKTTSVNIASHEVDRNPGIKHLECDNNIHRFDEPSNDIPLKVLNIVLRRCDYMLCEKHRTQSKPSEDITDCKKQSTLQKFDNYKNDELKITKAVITSYNKPVKCKTIRKQHIPTNSCESYNKLLECDFCNKRFISKSFLIKHIRIHTGEKPFKCNICSKSYSQKGHLNRHNNIHNGKKLFKCNYCSKHFTQKDSLHRHVRSHTGDKSKKHCEKPHKCNICFNTFDRKSDLCKHNRIHTGERPYKCNLCSKRFSAQSNLVAHNRTHTGEKPYKCNICHNTFSRKNGLKKHNRVHTGHKPFQCDICNKLFTQKFSLVSHFRLHNAEKPFKCDNCSKCYTQKSHLVVHLRGKCKSKKT